MDIVTLAIAKKMAKDLAQSIPKGDAGTIEVGTVTPGDTLSVTNRGTPQNAILDFVVPTSSAVDESIVNSIVLAQDTQPTEQANKIWVKTDSLQQHQIPTRQAFERVSGNVSQLMDNMGQVATVTEPLEISFDYSNIIETGIFIRPSGSIGTSAAGFATTPIELKKGEKLRITALAASTSYSWLSRWNDDGTWAENLKTSVAREETTFEYTATHDVEFVRFSNGIANVNNHYYVTKIVGGRFEIAEQMSNAVKQLIKEASETVEIDVGPGYAHTDLVEVINSIGDSRKEKQYVIKLHEGVYDTVVESAVDANYRGLIVPNYVSIIGVGNRDSIVIRGQLTNPALAQYANNISTINLTMNGLIENVTITAKNLRYCNHDDGTDATVPGSMIDVEHSFANVRFVVLPFDEGFSSAGFCVGIGNQKHKAITFEQCIFVTEPTDSTRVGILAHDNASSLQTDGCRLTVRECVFDIKKGYDVRVQNSGGIHDCYVTMTGNRMSQTVRLTNANTSITKNVWKIYAYCNAGFEFSNGTALDVTNDIVAFGNFDSI